MKGASLIKSSESSENQKMKKFFRLCALSFIFMLTLSPVYSQEAADDEKIVPRLLEGVWENYSRYVVFDTGYATSAGEAIPQIVLRTFYQWYDDRAAESPEYSVAVLRDSNAATQTSSQAQEIHVRFVPLTDELFTADYGIQTVRSDGDVLIAENENSGAWDMQVEYVGKRLGGREIYHIPVAVIGGDLYLDFTVRMEDSSTLLATPILSGNILENENPMAGYWQDYGSANGILESPPIMDSELLSYYVSDSAVYPIRYWVTDMEYDADARASIVDGDDTYYVTKHLWVGGKNYTCTLGRRTQIRNLQKIDSLPSPYRTNSVLVEKHALDDDGNEFTYTVRTSTICAFGEPYLRLTDGSKSIEEIIKADNSRKKDPPKPLFPVTGGPLDFDWSIIENPPADYNRRMLDLGK